MKPSGRKANIEVENRGAKKVLKGKPTAVTIVLEQSYYDWLLAKVSYLNSRDGLDPRAKNAHTKSGYIRKLIERLKEREDERNEA